MGLRRIRPPGPDGTEGDRRVHLKVIPAHGEKTSREGGVAVPESGYESVVRDVLEGRPAARLTLECLLLVALGVRRLAIVAVPAELPDGEVLGAAVDYEFRSRLAGGASDLRTRFNDAIERRRLSPVAFKTHLLRSSFANNVLTSDSYRAHRAAARGLDLETLESEVRPTIREWYVCRREDEPAVKALLARRHELQKELRTKYRPEDPVTYYIYPEERDPEHVSALGAFLGYPGCCVAAYRRGRETGSGETQEMPEERAARQIREAEEGAAEGAAGPGPPGRRGGPTPTAYWLKDFFPCRPDCPEAVARGEAALAALAGLDARLGLLYEDLLTRNLARVRTGPESIREHENWLTRR